MGLRCGGACLSFVEQMEAEQAPSERVDIRSIALSAPTERKNEHGHDLFVHAIDDAVALAGRTQRTAAGKFAEERLSALERLGRE